MKHKINYIKAAVVIAIALALIIPIAPVLAHSDETMINEPLPSRLEDFTEGFEDGIVPPAGWLNIDYDGDGYSWENSTTYPHSGNYSAISYSFFEIHSLDPDNWLIAPAMIPSSTSVLSYWVDSYYGGFYEDHIDVWIYTKG